MAVNYGKSSKPDVEKHQQISLHVTGFFNFHHIEPFSSLSHQTLV
jgi:hypothetical protein